MEPKLPTSPTPIFDNSSTNDAPIPPSASPTQPISQPPIIQSIPQVGRISDMPPTPPGKGKIIKMLAGIIVIVVLVVIAIIVFPRIFQKPQENVTLTYWGIKRDEAAMKKILTKFQAEYPYITVTYVNQDLKQYRERLLTRINNGTGPDIFRFHNSWLPMLTSILLPLPDDVISPSSLKKAYYPVYANDLMKNGAIIGTPLQMDTLTLFTNTEIFKAAGVETPSSWQDFADAAAKLTVKDEEGRIKTSGAALGTADNITHVEDILSLLFVQNGVRLARIGNTPERASEALDFYTSFANGQEAVWDGTLDQSLIAFAKGNLAMYFGYSSDIVIIKETNPTLQFMTRAVPNLPGKKATIASYYAEGVSLKTKYPKETFLLLKYLSKKETLKDFFTEETKDNKFGELYPRLDMAEDLKENQLLYPFIEQGESAISSLYSGEAEDSGLNAELNGYLRNAVRAVSGGGSSEEAIETLIQGEAQVLVRYGL